MRATLAGSWPEKGQRPGTPRVDRPPLDSRSRSSLTLTIRPLRTSQNRKALFHLEWMIFQEFPVNRKQITWVLRTSPRWSKWKLRSEDFEENQEPSCGLVQLSWIQVTQFAQNGVALLQEGILPRSLPDEVASLSELQGPYLRSGLGLAAKVSGPLPHSKVPFCPLSLGIVPPSWLGFSPLL